MSGTNDNTLTYDYIIIGAGTSGSVAARRMEEGNINFTVCLLEADPRFICLLLFSFVIIDELFFIIIAMMI
jgi:choline dehydrogenase-like flavoprotein